MHRWARSFICSFLCSFIGNFASFTGSCSYTGSGSGRCVSWCHAVLFCAVLCSELVRCDVL